MIIRKKPVSPRNYLNLVSTFCNTFVVDLYSDDHVIHNRFGSPTKEKRKRGRPSKAITDKLKEQEQQAAEATKIEELKKVENESQALLDEGNVGRRKRKIKLPSRFQEVVQVLNAFFKLIIL